MAFVFSASAQTKAPIASDSILRPVDTVRLSRLDSAGSKSDTSGRSALEDSLGIRISPDALPSIVTATAVDSAVADMQRNLFFLYGNAQVLYEDLTLKAGQVTYNQADNTISATPLTDTAANAERPSFKQGSETFTYDYLRYNFKSKRAIVRNARTQYGEGYVHSKQIKRNPDNSIYGAFSEYTTCSLDTPHFGIRARRIKVVPGHIIVAGASNLEIEGVPTPIFLPFGVFPISETQRSGFRIPSYTIEEQRGLGLTNGGYYFHFSEYVDALVTGTIYSKGSYNVGLTSTYANRYHYNGGFSFNYGYDKNGEVYEPGATTVKRFAILWSHNTDPKATPGQSFRASVNIEKGNYYQANSYNPNLILNNTFGSSISYNKTWNTKIPASFSAALRHDQNTQSHIVNVTLPDVQFSANGITPFARKNPVGAPKWYEKITTSYSFNALARTSFYDSNFHLSQLGLNDFSIGFHHNIPVSASYTIARYINFTAGIAYNEYWLTERYYEFYDVNQDKLDTITHRGFYTARDITANASFSTRIYGIKRWKKGRLAGIRHVLEPSASINYIPNYAAPPFNYYYQAYLTPSGTLSYYSPYVHSIVGVPGGGGTPGHFASILGFGLNNNLQIKTRKSTDTGTSTKNISLIDGLSISGSYNLAADSFKWAPFSVAFRNNILEKVQMQASAVFDPYVYREGRRINVLKWSDGGALNFQQANLSFTSSLKSKAKSGNNTQVTRNAEAARYTSPGGYSDYLDFNIPWTLNITYVFNLQKYYRPTESGGDTLTLSHSALFSGDFNLTAHWKVNFTSGYDFSRKQLSMTRFDIYRDLHCWEMRLGTIPFGQYKSYDFTINVKASVLQDLKLMRRRDYRDALLY